MRCGRLIVAGILASLLGACAPEVGSPAWCKAMEGKAKGDWSAHEAGDYAKFCVLGIKPAD